jgi:predicted MFS family arabinose efflux permease
MLIVGLALFTAASVAIGLAQTSGWLISARAIQGLAGAILAPSTLALLQTTFTDSHERTRAISYYSAVAGIAASVGLVLGGVLADWLSWRVGFFINLPIGIGMIVAALRYIPEQARKPGQFDVAGALTSTAGMVALVYSLIRSASHGWSDAWTIPLLVFALALLAIFIMIEWRAKQPIVPLHLFANRERSAAYAARLLFIGAMIGFFFFITQFMQVVSGYRPAVTGLAFLPMTLINFAAAMVVPQLTRRYGNAYLLATGLSFSLAGIFWLSHVSAASSYWTGIGLPMVLIGLGQGLALSPMTASGIAGVAGENAGAASGVVNVAHQIGNSLGLAVLVAVAIYGTLGLEGADLLAHRVGMALTGSSAMMALALVLVVAFIVRPAHMTSSIAEERSA